VKYSGNSDRTRGIYFFENDHQEAYNWAKYYHKLSDAEIEVIRADIVVSKDEVLDLIDSQTHLGYTRLMGGLSNKFFGEDMVPNLDHANDCRLINWICDKKGYKLVRGVFSPGNKLVERLIEERKTRIRKYHIQLCVRNECIIKSFGIYSRRSERYV
jgi:hypothetical protein